MSRDRMDKLWEQFTVDLLQRRIGNCKTLIIATRWSVHDPIGRLESANEDNPRAHFIRIPALNENDESNFDYKYGVGFTTDFYREQREIMDDVSWRALYMNQPIEREGLLYDANELRRYFELPDREPDAIISVCDTKDRGTDYCVMPIAYQYGNDYYIEDVVCDNSNPEIVEPRLVEKCIKHKVQMSRFESNSAGGRVAQSVQAEIKRRGGITKITTKYTTQQKETKIIMASPFVKEHFLFKDETVYGADKEYRRFMNFLCSYTMAGKNKFDDVPDAVAMLSDYVQSFSQSRVEIVPRLW
jgi:predicted phage terminase large subunit-like protein